MQDEAHLEAVLPLEIRGVEVQDERPIAREGTPAGNADGNALRVEFYVRENVVCLRAHELLGEFGLNLFEITDAEPLDIIDLGSVSVDTVVGRTGTIDRDKRYRYPLFFLERLKQRDLFGMRDAVQLRWLGNVDQLRNAELAAGVVDVRLPAQERAHVLHLNAHLA